jgi:hypothetical protein
MIEELNPYFWSEAILTKKSKMNFNASGSGLYV